jgi:hypothetical protein
MKKITVKTNTGWEGVFSIFILAVLSNSIWLIELFIYGGWGGLEWISNLHYSLYVIPVLFIIWLYYICFRLKVKIRPILYIIIYALFFYVSLNIFYIQMNDGPGALFTLLYYSQYFPHFIVNTYYYVCTILEIILIYILNIIICLFETKKLIFKDIIIISLHVIIIPVLSIIISYIILSIIKQYDRYCLEPIHWFKTGSIIFGFVFYECSYIYYIKNKKGAQRLIPITASSSCNEGENELAAGVCKITP